MPNKAADRYEKGNFAPGSYTKTAAKRKNSSKK